MVRGIRQPVEELDSLSFMLEGEVDVRVEVTETEAGDLEFTLTVMDTGESIGDLRGFFFDLGDPALAGGLQVFGDDVSGSKFAAGDVMNLGQGNNMNGVKSEDGSDFDGGIAFGNQGIGKDDDIRETSFTLSHPDQDLSLDDLANAEFGLRITSVGPEDGARSGSLKIVSEMPDPDDLGDPDPRLPIPNTVDGAEDVAEQDDAEEDDGETPIPAGTLAQISRGDLDLLTRDTSEDEDEIEEEEELDVPDFMD